MDVCVCGEVYAVNGGFTVEQPDGELRIFVTLSDLFDWLDEEVCQLQSEDDSLLDDGEEEVEVEDDHCEECGQPVCDY